MEPIKITDKTNLNVGMLLSSNYSVGAIKIYFKIIGLGKNRQSAMVECIGNNLQNPTSDGYQIPVSRENLIEFYEIEISPK